MSDYVKSLTTLISTNLVELVHFIFSPCHIHLWPYMTHYHLPPVPQVHLVVFPSVTKHCKLLCVSQQRQKWPRSAPPRPPTARTPRCSTTPRRTSRRPRRPGKHSVNLSIWIHTSVSIGQSVNLNLAISISYIVWNLNMSECVLFVNLSILAGWPRTPPTATTTTPPRHRRRRHLRPLRLRRRRPGRPTKTRLMR